MEITVSEDQHGKRLDTVAAEAMPRLSRAFVQKLCAGGRILVNDSPTKAGHKLREGDKIIISYDESELDEIPQIDLPVLHEDGDIVVINKPAGVLTHTQGALNTEPTVATFLRDKISQPTHVNPESVRRRGAEGIVQRSTLSEHRSRQADTGSPRKTSLFMGLGSGPQASTQAGLGPDGVEAVRGLGGERAGVVHRLDRATSGVILGAKNSKALSFLQKQFAQRRVKKSYTAIIEGHPKQAEAIIDMPIERNPKAPATFRTGSGGKSALTHYKILQENDSYSLVELKPETGRTHQLRVHMAKIGHPIVGDPLYGHGTFGDRLYLHAASLEITLPSRKRKVFSAPLPKEFKAFMEQA